MTTRLTARRTTWHGFSNASINQHMQSLRQKTNSVCAINKLTRSEGNLQRSRDNAALLRSLHKSCVKSVSLKLTHDGITQRWRNMKGFEMKYRDCLPTALVLVSNCLVDADQNEENIAIACGVTIARTKQRSLTSPNCGIAVTIITYVFLIWTKTSSRTFIFYV